MKVCLLLVCCSRKGFAVGKRDAKSGRGHSNFQIKILTVIIKGLLVGTVGSWKSETCQNRPFMMSKTKNEKLFFFYQTMELYSLEFLLVLNI